MPGLFLWGGGVGTTVGNRSFPPLSESNDSLDDQASFKLKLKVGSPTGELGRWGWELGGLGVLAEGWPGFLERVRDAGEEFCSPLAGEEAYLSLAATSPPQHSRGGLG